jgi:putative DNA primase/helicase
VAARQWRDACAMAYPRPGTRISQVRAPRCLLEKRFAVLGRCAKSGQYFGYWSAGRLNLGPYRVTTSKRSLVSRKRLAIRIAAPMSKKPPHDLVTAALQYAALGLSVVPVHSIKDDGRCTCKDGKSCTSRGKHPRTARGIRDATRDPAEIESFWAKWPDANIGIATGRPSGIAVIDIDPRNGGLETIEHLEADLGALPTTPMAFTGGGGAHLIFNLPAITVRKAAAGPGIDVLGDGCMMVAPPSCHVSGESYSWEQGLTPDDVRPANLPRKWLERLGGGKATPVVPVASSAGAVSQGQRNTHLTSVAGGSRRAGLSQTAITAALKAENVAACNPPLDDAEVEKIAGSIGRYPLISPPKGEDLAEYVIKVLLQDNFSGGDHLMACQDGQFWRFDGKKWVAASRRWIEGRVIETIRQLPDRGSQRTASLVKQVVTLLEGQLAVEDDLLRFTADPPSVINCANGELWLGRDGAAALGPHRPKSYLRQCLDVNYDPKAQCPKYDSAVAEIFSNAEDLEAMVRHWHELVGYLIQPRRHIPLILVCVGGGSNGKSMLVQTITRLLGPGLVSAQRIENLDKHRFASASLLGKLLLVDDDVRAGIRLPDGELKKISEAKPITAEHKYGPTFEFVVRSVPVLLCNNNASLADVSHGMARRLMVLPFDRTFRDDADPTLFPTIWETEMAGVLNRSIDGLRRLLGRRQFELPIAVRRANDEWLKEANPLTSFVDECCSRDPLGQCLLKDFYAEYRQWAQERGYTRMQQYQTVKRNLENLGFPNKRSNQGVVISGLTLRGAR